MAQGTQVKRMCVPVKNDARLSHPRKSFMHGLRITAIALIGLVCAGVASADSLALMSGSGQRGLGGSASVQPLVVEVRNVDGAVIAGRTINWSSSNGFVPSANSSVTDANGRASVNFTFGNYGTTNILASDSVGGTSMQAPETATGQDSITLISGNGQTGQAGTAGSQPIVVQVLDAAGNAVVGRTVNWSDTTAYTHVSAATSTTNASGFASMTFTYFDGPPVAAGTPAGILATNSIGGQSVTASVTEIGTNVLTITSGLQVNGLVGQTSAPIVAHVADWQGNPIAGATVTWSSPATGVFNLSSTSTITDASGNASITAQYIGATGDDIITADHNGFSLDVHFYLQTQTHIDVLSPNPIIGSPNTASSTPMAIQDFNKDGTPRVGDTITWSVQSGDAVPNAPTSVTDATGKATMGFTFGTLLTQFLPTDSRGVSKGVLVNPSVSGQSVQLVSGAGQTGLSQSAAASPVVMRVVDQAGVPQAGVTVNWTQYANGTFGFQGNVVYTSPTTTVSDAAGLVQATFKFGAVGKIAIRAELLSTLGSAAIVTSYGSETLTVLSGSGQSGLVGTHGAQPVVVVFRDQAGNPLANKTITWAVTNGNAVLDATSSLTNASGQASIGFTYGAAASINNISASATSSNASVGQISVDAFVTGVGANSLSLISGNGQTGVIGAAGAQPLVVEVRDAAGNPVAGRTINWTYGAGIASATAPSSIAGANGRASVGFLYAANPGPTTITATDSVNGQAVNFNLTGIQLDDHVRILSGDGQTGLPSTPGQPIVIEFRDPVTNLPLSGQTVIWSVASGPATLGAVTTSSDANGLVHANFNFGATPGTSIIQATGAGGPTHGMLQATVVTLGNNQALTIVSGNNQTLIGSTTSAPLIVQLKDTFNAPVVGATINWTATNGTLNAASSVTDANGKASNTVSASGTGPVTVQANSTRASAPVTFNFTNGLVKLPGLTPEQTATAGALDNACPALANKPNLTPQEADLLAQCQALSASSGVNTGATVAALNQLLTKTTQVQSTASSVAAVTQFQNIDARLNALRSGSQTSSLGGLSFNGADGIIPIGALLNGFLSATDNKKDAAADAGFSKWGLFVTGTLGHGAARPGTLSPGYDYDTNGLTFGIDYRKQDNWIFGAALGYSRQDTDLSQSAGSVGMTGYSLSAYNTFTFKKTWYIDSVITLGHNSFDLSRRIAYTLPLPDGTSMTVNQTATSHPGGDFREAALTFGGDFHKEAWNFSPYGQLIYSRLGFDSYSETLQNGPGSGLGLAVNARSVTGLTSILGTRVSFSHSANWGVIVPTASLEWNHEFKSDPQAINAQFIFDPTHTPIKIFGDASDSDYFRLGLGFSAVLPHGESAFLLYERTLDRNGLSQYNIAVGMRLEF